MGMMCHQCQETMKNTACTLARGVCGKTDRVSGLQDVLLHVCKGIGYVGKRAGFDDAAAVFVMKSLFATITNANFKETWFMDAVREGIAIRDAMAHKGGLKDLPAWVGWKPFSDGEILDAGLSERFGWTSCKDEDIRSLRALVLYGLKGIAAYAEHAYALGKSDKSLYEFILRALSSIGDDTVGQEALLALVLETGKFGVDAMALLDGANTGTYGKPRIAKVKLGTGGKPGILISGHDLRDLRDLLEQTKGTGIDVYTHGEMLPAHYYPAFEKYDNLAGNYGGAWYAQGTEFESFNGPVLLTSNCLVPPKDGYKARVFTTGVVGFDGCAHIADRVGDGMKDFSKLVEMAKKCPPPKQLEEGTIVGGFAHDQVLALADKVVAAVKSGKIRKFVVMAGCDGRMPSRQYYSDFANKLPKDVVILTAGCAKYRYNKLPLGDIDGIPRVLDAGQCNDSYSLALIALALKEAFALDDVNKLPLVFNIAWYEQKAVLVLLALLHLGFRNIHLGPTLPGFLSPNVASILVKTFGIAGTKTVDEDIALLIG